MSELEQVNDHDLIHQLKNHLSVIAGFCEVLLVETGAEDPRRADLLEMHQAAQNAIAVIQEVPRRVRR